jgi:hypothetical protein
MQSEAPLTEFFSARRLICTSILKFETETP